MYDVVIIGAGTAGMSAAIYGRRAGKTVLVLEEKVHGGQIINTPRIENYPGIANISGYEFANSLYQQAKELGAEFVYDKVTGIRDGVPKLVQGEKGEYGCRAVILATGARNRRLGLEGEQRLTGKGISYCATCDGFFYKDKTVAVVGGGNTALEDAFFLAGICRKVYLIHRRDSFRGEQLRWDELKKKDNVEFILSSIVAGLQGEDRLDSIVVEGTGQEKGRWEISVDGLFIAVGQTPDNEAFRGVVDLDEGGYIVAGEDCHTSAEGIFAAGDCRTKTVRQLTTAAADGAVAAIAAGTVGS